MRYGLYCASVWDRKDIVDKYPVVKKYKPKIDYPYPNSNAARLTVEIDDIVEFYKDIERAIIIDQDTGKFDEGNIMITIYDDWIE